nr:hypothetical protein [uncultured Rhodopila sp.]
MSQPMLYIFTCLALGGCVTNNLTTQNAQIAQGGGTAPARSPVPAAAPGMTPAARLATARVVTVDKTIMAGQTLLLASPQSLARDCTPLGKVDAKVITPPENGTIHIDSGMAFPNFTPGDPPYLCNSKKLPATVISYRSTPGFSGRDTAVVQFFFPDGNAPTFLFHIAVR